MVQPRPRLPVAAISGARRRSILPARRQRLSTGGAASTTKAAADSGRGVQLSSHLSLRRRQPGTMREVVTIQVGGFANFIGSHFWNFQDELVGLAGDRESDPAFRNHGLNMDVLYRAGETHEGVLTYTPRLVSIDCQGTLGSMSSRGTLYNQIHEVPSSVATWRGRLSTQRIEPRKKNLFLQSLCEEEEQPLNGMKHGQTNTPSEVQDKDIVACLENEVVDWTDFSKVHYHPQSLYELNGLWVDAQEFDNYGIGKDTFSEGFRGEELNDKLRFFVEECDHMQGIQFMVDDSGGFSGLAADFLENIADDFPNTPVMLYAVRGPDSYINSGSRKNAIFRNLHNVISFSRLSAFCKLMVPIGLPSLGAVSRYLCVNDDKRYHCSAVYASALHSLSLPYRMEVAGPTASTYNVSGSLDLDGIIQVLSGEPRQNKVAILDIAMPAPSLTGELDDQLLLSSLQPLTPEVAKDVEDLQSVESLIVHGILQSGDQRVSISEVQDAIGAAYQKALKRPRFCHLSSALCPLPVPLPFPSIFSNVVGKHGEILGTPGLDLPSKGSLDVHSIPMAARLRSSNAILPYLSSRLESLQQLGIQRGALGAEILRNWGFGKEELEDMGETLCKMVRGLDPGSQESSDSD